MSNPTKQQVREYIKKRAGSRRPPPDGKEVRKQLGWELDEMIRTGVLRRQY